MEEMNKLLDEDFELWNAVNTFIVENQHLYDLWITNNRARINKAIGPGPLTLGSKRLHTMMRMFYEDHNNKGR